LRLQRAVTLIIQQTQHAPGECWCLDKDHLEILRHWRIKRKWAK
jgi:hypothetical protein